LLGNKIDSEGKVDRLFNLLPNQERLLLKVTESFSKANSRISDQHKKLVALEERLAKYKKRNEDLGEELRLYAEEYIELEKKYDALKDNNEEQRERFRKSSASWEKEKNRLQEDLESFSSRNQELQKSLDGAKKELAEQKTLGHSTLQDAKHRANVEVQSRLDSLSRAILPILKEVEEFEALRENLPSRALMLLNIINKLKNALKMNGVLV